MEEQNRTVVHMDLDSFFVSVSRLINPKLVGKPVIVGGTSDRGVVAACSYETRAFGIHSAMPIRQAKRLCPDAIIIRGDYDEYSKRSDEVTQIIREEAPVFERSSIDEFYLDISGMDRFFGCYTWATELRKKIKNETGLPISFGMSKNKTVSKIATDEAKPDNQLKIDYGREKSFLAPLSIKKIPMIGEKTYRLLRTMGIEKVLTLQSMPVELMENVLGDNGIVIWKKANGIDNTPVQPYSEQKSVSTEETFEQDTIDVTKLKNILIAMTEKLCFRLRSENRLTSCVTVKIRYSNFDTHTLQSRIPYSSSDHTLIARVKELFDKLYNRRMLIRLIGVRFSHLVGGGHQINMFEDSEAILNLYYAMDKMRLLYGEDKIQRAAALHYSLRSFNPFNGVNSSPSALQKTEGHENAFMPSVKSMNKLFNLGTVKTNSTDLTVDICEYKLIIPLPYQLQQELMELKRQFHHAEQAVVTPFSITLISFMADAADEEKLLRAMGEVLRCYSSFDVVLKNFNRHQTTSIYIEVENYPAITTILRSLRIALNLPPSRTFFAWKPQVTLVRQLMEEKFTAAMETLKGIKFHESFIAGKIILMKRDGSFSRYQTAGVFELVQ